MFTAVRRPDDSDAPLLAIPSLRKELRAAGVISILVSTLFLLGFAPSWLQFFTVGQFHLDPWFQAGAAIVVPWWILRSHAKLATVWGILAILQTMLGMGLFPKTSRKVHRVLGYFLIFLGVLAFGSGSLLEVLEYGGCITWLHLLEAVMIFLHFGFLIHFARARHQKEHALTALSLFVWTLYPGWGRICGFVLGFLLGIPCGLQSWDGYEFFAASSCAAGLLMLAWREHRLPGRAMEQSAVLIPTTVLLLSSLVFSMYASIDLINASFVADTFLRCPD